MNVPSFMCIGAQKAGTTWLYEMLSKHPEVGFSEKKEIHFWDKEANYSKGLGWYLSLFETDKVYGDITPAYALLPSEKIKEVHHLNPNLKILFILRNPIERAWSMALMQLRASPKRKDKPIDKIPDSWFIKNFLSEGSLARGDYLKTILNWTEIFGEDNILILRYDDIKKDPRDFLYRVCAHIGVNSNYARTLDNSIILQRVHEGSGHALRRSLLPTLLTIYEPRIVALGEHLKWDLSGWLS
ncbi:MAG: sulfotransferase domain-containing protein [Gammaproteobacteria bacterium]